MSADTGPRRQSSRVSKGPELYEPPLKKACHVNAMLTAMAASVAAGDSFSLLATTELKGQDGRVVKAPSLIAENELNIRRICVGSKSCSLKEVHRLGGW